MRRRRRWIGASALTLTLALPACAALGDQCDCVTFEQSTQRIALGDYSDASSCSGIPAEYQSAGFERCSTANSTSIVAPLGSWDEAAWLAGDSALPWSGPLPLRDWGGRR